MKTGPFYRVNHFIIFSLHFSLNYLVSILFSESWCGTTTLNWNRRSEDIEDIAGYFQIVLIYLERKNLKRNQIFV